MFVPRAELLLTEEEVSLSDSNSPGKVVMAIDMMVMLIVIDMMMI